jgi:tetratricopeptide (TPR) repeat protein
VRVTCKLTIRFEIPRLLLSHPEAMHTYISNCQDKELLTWFAQYLESLRDYEGAIDLYTRTQEMQGLVRCYAQTGNFSKSKDLAYQSSDSSAKYYLASLLETSGQVKDAIAMYEAANCYPKAIQLAKTNGFDNELMRLALQGNHECMHEVAE